MKFVFRALLIPLFILSSLHSAAVAQSADGITIQLNTAETAGQSCRLTFVINNKLPDQLDALGLDLVMFDETEGVSGYAAVDFGSMPPGKTIVRQYDVGQGTCEATSRILLNEVRECQVNGKAVPNCLETLTITSRSKIDFVL